MTPTRLIFFTQPVGALYGHPLATQPVVQAVDAEGNVALGFTGEITLTLQGGAPGAALDGTAKVAAVDGVATFDGLSVDLPGTGYTLVATSGGLAGATSEPFDVLAILLYLPAVMR